MLELIFGTAALAVVITGLIAEKHIEDESWGKKKRFRQQVEMNYRKMLIRHRTPYAQIGYRPRGGMIRG